MLRRYGIPSIIIIVVALASAGLAYKVGSKLTYTSYCTIEVFVRAPATQEPAANPDFLTFTNSLAANEVNSATPTVYANVAQRLHLKAATFADKIVVVPAPGIAAFAVSVTDSDHQLPQRIAQEACTEFVSVVTAQRAREVNNDLQVIQGRIDTLQKTLKRLQAIPANRRNENETLDLVTQQQAVKNNAFLVAAYKSLPPDTLTVLLPATKPAAARSASLKKYVLIAAVAALLVIFLFILVGEAIAPPDREAPAAGDLA